MKIHDIYILISILFFVTLKWKVISNFIKTNLAVPLFSLQNSKGCILHCTGGYTTPPPLPEPSFGLSSGSSVKRRGKLSNLAFLSTVCAEMLRLTQGGGQDATLQQRCCCCWKSTQAPAVPCRFLQIKLILLGLIKQLCLESKDTSNLVPCAQESFRLVFSEQQSRVVNGK